MRTTLKAVATAALIGLATLLPGTASAGATSPVPAAPKPQCQASESHLCPPPPDVKAKPPRGYTIPKKPPGY